MSGIQARLVGAHLTISRRQETGQLSWQVLRSMVDLDGGREAGWQGGRVAGRRGGYVCKIFGVRFNWKGHLQLRV